MPKCRVQLDLSLMEMGPGKWPEMKALLPAPTPPRPRLCPPSPLSSSLVLSFFNAGPHEVCSSAAPHVKALEVSILGAQGDFQGSKVSFLARL